MLCYDWHAQDLGKLTVNPAETPIWVVSMQDLNFNALTELKKKRGEECLKVIAFTPTGWNHSSSKSGSKKGGGGKGRKSTSSSSSSSINSLLSVRKMGDIVLYSVPYSEHSSFTELVDFVQVLRPDSIKPTVSTTKAQVSMQLNALKQAAGIYGAIEPMKEFTGKKKPQFG